jgi:hypothetical protein
MLSQESGTNFGLSDLNWSVPWWSLPTGTPPAITAAPSP